MRDTVGRPQRVARRMKKLSRDDFYDGEDAVKLMDEAVGKRTRTTTVERLEPDQVILKSLHFDALSPGLANDVLEEILKAERPTKKRKAASPSTTSSRIAWCLSETDGSSRKYRPLCCRRLHSR